MPKLVDLVGLSLTLAEELSPFTTRSDARAPSARLPVLVSGYTSTSVATPGYRASYSRPAKRRSALVFSYVFRPSMTEVTCPSIETSVQFFCKYS